MLLTKLEIKGFKSFGDQATISFDKGVTGIVGPNGCGKSNVVDAIRWVLGEQKTKSLRSDKMENIIFNGTNQRKPALVAQVSLTFLNDRLLLPAEYTEVTITRRFHRSGESEYLINEVRCRLKDIYNLFLDTGIGSDSYAIIELKKVDDILNDKENSRRDLFEKAAGISKFKVRKKESLARLEFVDKDLDRVGDLLFEIEKNLKNLEKQARQAERYFKLKDEYKQISLAYAQKSISREIVLFENLQQKIRQETEKRTTLQAQIAEKETKIEQEKENLLSTETLLAEHQRLLNSHLATIRQIESDRRIKNERIHFLNEKNTTIRQQIALDLQSLNRLKEEIERISSEEEKANLQKRQLETDLAGLKENFETQKQKVAELQSQVKSKENQIQATQNQVFQLNKSLEIKQAQRNATKQELEKTFLNESKHLEELAHYETSLEKTILSLQIAKQELDSFQEKEERKNQEITQLEGELEQMRRQLQESLRTLDSKQNEYNLTKSMTENMEGFPDALKFLQKETTWANDIPLLSDIISCEENFRIAIENFLEPWLNYYVVPYESKALEALQLLQNAQKGKANFFILDKIETTFTKTEASSRTSKLDTDALSFLGALNPADLQASYIKEKPVWAMDVIHYEPEHELLLQVLLKNLWIVQDETYFHTKDETKNFVTLSGEVIHRHISISGGSVGAFEGKRLGRLKNLEKLESEIQLLKQTIHTQQEDFNFKQTNLQNLKKDYSYREGIINANKSVNLINEEFISLKTKKEQLLQLISRNSDNESEVQERMADLETEIEQLQPQISQKQTALQAISEEIEILKENWMIENEHLQVQSNRLNQLNIQFFQQKNKTESLSQEIQYKSESFQQLKERISHQEKELVNLENDLENLLENQENYDERLKDLHNQTEVLELNLRNTEKVFYSLRATIQDQEKEIKEAQRGKELQDNLIHQIETQLHSTELHLTGIKERLLAEFEVDFQELLQHPIAEEQTNITEADLKIQADDLKQKIERLGTINALAMEEYNETKARFDFISAQKADLVTSKSSLLKTIQEMESFAHQAFMKAFEEIRLNFIKVFRSLFSKEDNADLVLAEPQNPLESKIDIVAQPKGKRPLTIDQLSGGEKTLTATSLLFALYLLKPAPFCIFDEVDAPLDDANTDKFNNIIREFSKDSQFIIVTHNKRTMAMTDLMYGVTMVQPGVSTVVPVDLRELVV